MNVAMVLAGGVGSRVGAQVPKQFVEVEGRPVLAYAIEAFERHAKVDAVEVVVRPGWEGYLDELVRREGFTKVRWTAPAGEDFQHSVMNGLDGLEGAVDDDDVVLVHYGASPMTPARVITDAIRVCREHGNASPARAQVYLAAARQDGRSTDRFLDRDGIMVLNSPQAMRYGYARWLYAEGARRGLLEVCDPHTTSLMLAMGERVWFSKDTSDNIKITTPEDLRLFRGWVLTRQDG